MKKLPRVPSRTTPGFAFSTVNRALQDCLGRRRFGQPEIQSVLSFFGADPPECVYCGSEDVSRWDHIVPISRGGETIVGNLVPACSGCDDSKRDLDYEEWIGSNAPLSPQSRSVNDLKSRVARIRDYVKHSGYTPTPLSKRLDRKQLERLEKINRQLTRVRRDVDDLIEDVRGESGRG